MRTTKLSLALLTLCECNFLIHNVDGACETEGDLGFDSCDLRGLQDGVLKGICDRIGLDMEEDVLPYLFEKDEGEKSGNELATIRTYTHEDFVRGTEECLMVEDEMNQLEVEDSGYLEQFERDLLVDDPEMVAEVIANVLKHDLPLLKEIASKLVADLPDAVKDMEGMLGGGENLEDRPDVVGHIVAELLTNPDSLGTLDEFGELLAELVEDLGSDEEPGVEGFGFGDGEEL